jgi:general secretion pathway protein B
MSFILEALKKSEQQRQQKNASQQKVRKRTLSLPSHQSNRRLYWILTGLLSITLLCGWWLYSNTEQSLEQPPVANQRAIVPSPSQPEVSKPVVTTPTPAAIASAVASDPQRSVLTVEPAPVPRVIVSPPAPLPQTSPTVPISKQSQEPAPELDTIDRIQLKPIPTQLPLYLDLSRELRDRMPNLAMSMHYYTTNPDRRLVRINNQLLHEDDWVDQDLQIIEITPTGATLDFMGKLFEMRSPSR